jgi:hypothetical protein
MRHNVDNVALAATIRPRSEGRAISSTDDVERNRNTTLHGGHLPERMGLPGRAHLSWRERAILSVLP